MLSKKHLTLLAIVAVVAVFASSATVPAASPAAGTILETGPGRPGAGGILPEAVARQADSRTLTPLDVARVRTVGEIAISPDGAQIAFTLSVPREPGSENNGPAWSELHLVGFDGSDHRPFVTGEVNVSHLRWTPDGAYVSYAARREGDDAAAIYVIPATGGESRRLVHYPTSVSNFEWRPDGRAVGFIARDPVDKELQELRAQGFNQEVYEEDNSARRIVVVELPDGPSGEAEEPQVIDGVTGHPYGIAWSLSTTAICSGGYRSSAQRAAASRARSTIRASWASLPGPPTAARWC
jgi:dipeptidyl aminopeptidase/acylaminoacyl peptidase